MSTQNQRAIQNLQDALNKCSMPDASLAHPVTQPDLVTAMANAYRVGYLTTSIKDALKTLGAEVTA